MASTSEDRFHSDIKHFLQRNGMSPTMFGMLVANDGNFVTRVNEKTRIVTVDRITAWMHGFDYMAVSGGPKIGPNPYHEKRAAIEHQAWKVGCCMGALSREKREAA